MVRINATLYEWQLQVLRRKQIEDGVPIAEQIRRAINMLIYADKANRKTKR